MVEQSLIRRQSGQWLATHHFGPYLVWRAIGSDQLAGPDIPWHICLFFFSPDHIIESALVELFDLQLWKHSQPYILYNARKLRVNCAMSQDFKPMLDYCVTKTKIWQRLGIMILAWIYWYCIPVSTKANGLPSWFIPNIIWTPWWVVKHRTNEKYTTVMASSLKKTKRNLSESSSESDDEEITRFPRFIVLEAQDDSSLIPVYNRKNNIFTTKNS